MAYQQPPAGYPPYGVPSPSHSPQPGYHQPPPSQYQPQGHSLYPQERGLNPPPGQYPPQGYPPQGYPPPPAIYNQNQAAYNQNQGYPPQGYPPPQAPYSAQQQGFHGFPQAIPTPPSPGYGPNTIPFEDATVPADTLRRAMKGLGTDEATIIGVLAHYPATSLMHLKSTYEKRHHRSLEKDIISETSSDFRETLLAILRGPLEQDVHILHKALDGLGTNEDRLDDVLLARSNADMNAIKQAYHAIYHKALETKVSGDLSGKTDRLFSMVLSATRQEDSAPVLPQAVDADVTELHRATEGQYGTDQLTVCSILTSRSDGQIRAISHAYQYKYRTSLEQTIQKEFSGHMEHALVRIVRAATDRAMLDAELLDNTMTIMRTNDATLIERVVRLHWNREHLGQVKGAYRVRYKKDLVEKIRKKLSGDYERLLVAMLQ